MGKLKSLITGTLLGAGGMYVGLQYHVLQAEEGFLFVPRTPQQRIQDAYADVRDWDAATWSARPRMALAVTEYGRGDLITSRVANNLLDQLRQSIDPSVGSSPSTLRGWEPATTTSTSPNSRGMTAPPATAAPVAETPVRRGFLPLADLFGIGPETGAKRGDGQPASPVDATPILPAGVTTPKAVDILPTPGAIEMLDGPADVQLGPAAPIPGQPQRVDRRRTDATNGWQPTTVQPF